MASQHAIKLLIEYLNGNLDRKAVDKAMLKVYSQSAKFNTDFHLLKMNHLQGEVNILLNHFDIDEQQKKRLLGHPITFSTLLEELQPMAKANQGDAVKLEKLKQFINLTEAQESTLQMKKIMFAVLAVWGLLQAALPFFYFMGGVSAVQTLVASTLFLPIASLVFTVGVAGFSLIQSFYDPAKSTTELFLQNFFLLGETALKIAAYSVLLAAGVNASPVAAILFVAASLSSAIKVVGDMILHDSLKSQATSVDKITLDDKLQTAREEVKFQRDKKILGTELAGALGMVACVALMSFFPGAIFVTIPAVVTMGLIFLTQTLVKSSIEKNSKVQLEERFEEIEKEFFEENEPDSELNHEIGNDLEDEVQKKRQKSLDHDPDKQFEVQDEDRHRTKNVKDDKKSTSSYTPSFFKSPTEVEETEKAEPSPRRHSPNRP